MLSTATLYCDGRAQSCKGLRGLDNFSLSTKKFTIYWSQRSLETDFILHQFLDCPHNLRLGLIIPFYSMICYSMSRLHGKLFFFPPKKLFDWFKRYEFFWRIQDEKNPADRVRALYWDQLQSPQPVQIYKILSACISEYPFLWAGSQFSETVMIKAQMIFIVVS